MLKNKFLEKNKLILFLSVLLLFGSTLIGCNWFSNGIINVFDPQAQVRVTYNPVDVDCPENSLAFNLSVSSINEVEFFITGFDYKYEGEDYNSGHIQIPELGRIVEVSFYVEPSSSPGSSGEKTTICNIPFYFQEVKDYVNLNPSITEITMDCTLLGIDGSGHNLSVPVTTDFPVNEPGIDLTPPTAAILTDPSPANGNIPLTVIFDGSQSCDKRNSISSCLTSGIKTFKWDFDDGETSSSMIATHVYDNPGIYVVTLTVTDYFDNQDTATVTVETGEGSGPSAEIETIPDPPNVSIGVNITFDGTDSSVGEDCGCGTTIESYQWNFGDGETGSGSIVTHSYSSAGTYAVTLTVTDSNGKSDVTSVDVTVI